MSDSRPRLSRKGLPPTTSYWIGQTREQLAASIAERRPQQQTPLVSDVTREPIVEATRELKLKKWLREVAAVILVLAVLPSLAHAQAVEEKPAPWWATTLAVSGPLADGLSTVHAIKQSGPHARVIEGNGFYGHLFGSNVRPAEIMAFKVGQAVLFGAIVHHAGKQNRKAAIGVAILTAGINGFVASRNMRTAAMVKRLNGGAR